MNKRPAIYVTAAAMAALAVVHLHPYKGQIVKAMCAIAASVMALEFVDNHHGERMRQGVL